MAQAAKKKPPTPPKKPAAKVAPKPTVKVPVKPVAAKPATPPAQKPAGKVVGVGHNNGIDKAYLKSVVDRVENLEEEKSGIADDIKDIYTDAKAKGLNPKTIRKIVAIRRKKKEELAKEKYEMDMYLFALDPELADVLS
jgi:uncharacterized protein (UPF0335 family)